MPITATYQIMHDNPAVPIESAARDIAVGQTLATWNETLWQAHADYLATVQDIRQVADCHYEIDIAYPDAAINSDFGTFLTVLFGKVSMAGAIRLVNIAVPPGWDYPDFQGPRFGLARIRQQLEKSDGPLLMGILKPCLGVAPTELAGLFEQAVLGGCQLIKDDEVLSDSTIDTAFQRLETIRTAQARASEATGRKSLYVINLTGPASQFQARAQALIKAGAQALLFNYLSYGLPMLATLRNDPAITVPIFAHPALGGAFYGSPDHGIAPAVLFGQLPRLAGADGVLFPSPYGKVCLEKSAALTVAQNLKSPLGLSLPALPIPSAGIKSTMVPDILRDFGTDVVVNAGTGIYDHPEGPQVSATHFRQAIATARATAVC